MINNLEDAITHAREVAKNWKSQLVNCVSEEGRNKCKECASEHEQLAKWLTQLKAVKDIVREFNDDTLGFTYSSSDFINAIIEAVSEEEK